MTNTSVTPNHFRLNMGICGGGWFGPLHRVDPVHYETAGQIDHVHIAFTYGLSLDLTRADAVRLLQALPQAINRLPATLPFTTDYSGIAAHLDGQP
jgi:hypothetical protein